MINSPRPFRIKICGLSTPETLDAAVVAGADMVGFVFHRKSPRSISREAAAQLADMARGRVETVALVVDCDLDVAASLAAEIRPDWYQLHGSETPLAVTQMRSFTDARQMKALGVATSADLSACPVYAPVSDLILLDAKPPKDAAYPGGHGMVFDWNILAGLDPTIPFMLSGGLTPDNVALAITSMLALGVNLVGVDVSSGVESAPGVKDIAKIKAFVQTAREAATSRQGLAKTGAVA
jgi:phosphoribosylanthranilate isomerase